MRKGKSKKNRDSIKKIVSLRGPAQEIVKKIRKIKPVLGPLCYELDEDEAVELVIKELMSATIKKEAR